MNDLWLYDPVELIWTCISSPIPQGIYADGLAANIGARHFYSMVMDKDIFVFGGFGYGLGQKGTIMHELFLLGAPILFYFLIHYSDAN